jgi:hypothetical protein
MEFGWMVDIVNVYGQVAQLVRTTSATLKEFRQARDDIQRTGALIGELYKNIENLADINPYDMNTWSRALDKLSINMTWDIYDILSSYDDFERHSLGNSIRFIGNVDKALDYDVRLKQNMDVAGKYYVNPMYQNYQNSFNQTLLQYKSNTVSMLQALRQNEVQELLLWQDMTGTGESKERIQNKIAQLKASIAGIDKNIQEVQSGDVSSLCYTKADSILQLSTNLIAMNMTEVQLNSERVKGYEQIVSQMQDDFENFRTGNLNTIKNDSPIQIDKIDFTNPKIGEKADQAPAPSAPSGIESPSTINKKDPSNKDILHFRNQIEFVLLKQEAALRDIELLKANTIAFIAAFEALQQHDYFDDVVIESHNGRLLQKEMQKALAGVSK